MALEDAPAIAALLRATVGKTCGDTPFVIHPTLMSAAEDMRKAQGVIIDWRLDDGIDALEAGVLDYLKQRGIPHVVFTSCPDWVPREVQCKVIDKSEVKRLVDVVADWLD